jgi:hypothetical protein
MPIFRRTRGWGTTSSSESRLTRRPRTRRTRGMRLPSSTTRQRRCSLPGTCARRTAPTTTTLSSFVDGWIVARTLFGGPSFAPLDELAFARAAGLLRPLIAVRQDRHVGACAAQWAEANPGRVADYEEWRGQAFLPVESDPELADTESRDADDAEVGAGDSDSGATPEGGVRQPPPDEPAGARPPDTGNGRDRCLCASTTR